MVNNTLSAPTSRVTGHRIKLNKLLCCQHKFLKSWVFITILKNKCTVLYMYLTSTAAMHYICLSWLRIRFPWVMHRSEWIEGTVFFVFHVIILKTSCQTNVQNIELSRIICPWRHYPPILFVFLSAQTEVTKTSIFAQNLECNKLAIVYKTGGGSRVPLNQS